METFDLTGLPASVANKITPMLNDLLAGHGSNIHSIHVTGSAVIADYQEKMSDINSVVVLHNMDLRFLNFLAPLGRKYGKRRIAAPLVMTPEYIGKSLDAFPVEFLDFKLIHKTVYGDDILRDIRVEKSPLRIQCEREVKSRLIGLRQGYLSSLGKRKHLAAVLVRSFTGSMALFRAIITLLGKEPPIIRAEVVAELRSAAHLDTDILQTMLRLKTGTLKPPAQDLHPLFEQYYNALESLGKTLDDLPS